MDWLLVVGAAVLLVFLTLKIAGMFGWPWWLVAAPLWIWGAIGNLVIKIVRSFPKLE